MTDAEKELMREATAYHEAGHVVVAFSLGWWLNDEGVEIDERWHTGLRRYAQDNTTEKQILVDLAGWLSEHKWHGRGGLRSDSELEWSIADARDMSDPDGWDDDDEWDDDTHCFSRLIGECPDASDAELIARYREFQARTVELLNRPEIWNQIRRVAAALVERGKLTDQDVRAILSE